MGKWKLYPEKNNGSQMFSSALDSAASCSNLCGVKIVYQIMLLIAVSMVACRPAGPKVVEAVDVEDLPPFDPATQQTTAHLNVSQVHFFLESNPQAIVLDVRPLEEYDKAHLPGAVSFPYDFKTTSIQKELEAHPNYDAKKVYLSYGSKENFYAIDVVSKLSAAGYQYLFSMNGGIEDWVREGLPLMSKEVVK